MAQGIYQNSKMIQKTAGMQFITKGLLMVSFFFLVNVRAQMLSQTPEGMWVGGGNKTVFLQGFSPYSLAANIALLAGTKYLSSFHDSAFQSLPHKVAANAGGWLYRMSMAGGVLGTGWSFAALMDSLELIPGQESRVVVDLDLPEVAHRLVIFYQISKRGVALVILRNPLAEPVPVVSGADGITRGLLSIHKEMAASYINRLELIPFTGKEGGGARVNWRGESGKWVNMTVGNPAEKSPAANWLSLSRFPGKGISVLQPLFLEHVLKVIRNGRVAGVEPLVALPCLPVERSGSDHWSVVLDPRSSLPVILEGVDNKDGSIRKLKLTAAGDSVADKRSIYQIPRFWTALAEMAVNIGSLIVDPRPAPGVEGMDEHQAEPSRYRLMQLGKAGVAAGGITAGVTRKGPRLTYTITESDDIANRRARIKDLDKVILGEGSIRELLANGVSLPCLLEFSGSGGAKAYGTLLEESAPPGTIMMSNHLQRALKLKPGEQVSIQPVDLRAGNKVDMKILEGPYRTDYELASVLNQDLPLKYPVLRESENIYVSDGYDEWKMNVTRLEPAKVVSSMNVNLDIKFDHPKDWPSEEELMLTSGQEPFTGRGETLKGRILYNAPRKNEEVELPPSSQVNVEPIVKVDRVTGERKEYWEAGTSHEYAPVYLHSAEEFDRLKEQGVERQRQNQERQRQEQAQKAFQDAEQSIGGRRADGNNNFPEIPDVEMVRQRRLEHLNIRKLNLNQSAGSS